MLDLVGRMASMKIDFVIILLLAIVPFVNNCGAMNEDYVLESDNSSDDEYVPASDDSSDEYAKHLANAKKVLDQLEKNSDQTQKNLQQTEKNFKRFHAISEQQGHNVDNSLRNLQEAVNGLENGINQLEQQHDQIERQFDQQANTSTIQMDKNLPWIVFGGLTLVGGLLFVGYYLYQYLSKSDSTPEIEAIAIELGIDLTKMTPDERQKFYELCTIVSEDLKKSIKISH